MVTDSAQHHDMPETPGFLIRVGGQVRQFFCGLHGHDTLLHFEKGRMSLLCSSCGYETPGWDTKTTPAMHGAAAPAPAPRVIRIPFAGERRIA